MTDAVDDHLSAATANDVDALMQTLTPDAELVSPLSSHLVFRGADGRIHRIRPHLRPWLALTVDAFVVGPKFIRHPGVVPRALHRST